MNKEENVLKKAKPSEKSADMETDDLLEITDKVDLAAYISEDKHGNKDVILRIYIEGKYDGVGLNIGPLSDTLIPKLQEVGVEI